MLFSCFSYLLPTQAFSLRLDQLEESNSKIEKNLTRHVVVTEWADQHKKIHDELMGLFPKVTISKEDVKKYIEVTERSSYLIKRMEVAKEQGIGLPLESGKPGLFRNMELDIKDIEKSMLSYLDIKSLIAMRNTSKYSGTIVNEIVQALIKDFNSKKIAPRDFGIRTIGELIFLISDHSKEIEVLDLRGLKRVDHDCGKISSFPNTKDLFVGNCEIDLSLVPKLPFLENLSIENYLSHHSDTDYIFLHHFPLLKNLHFSGKNRRLSLNSWPFENLSLANFSRILDPRPESPTLKKLNVAGQYSIPELPNLLKYFPMLEELNVSKEYIPNTYSIKLREDFRESGFIGFDEPTLMQVEPEPNPQPQEVIQIDLRNSQGYSLPSNSLS